MYNGKINDENISEKSCLFLQNHDANIFKGSWYHKILLAGLFCSMESAVKMSCFFFAQTGLGKTTE